MTRILFIDDDPVRSSDIAEQLREQGIDVTETVSVPEDLTADCDAIVCLDSIIGAAITDVSTQLPLVLLSDAPTVKASVAALQAGAKDYLALPLSIGDLMAAPI